MDIWNKQELDFPTSGKKYNCGLDAMGDPRVEGSRKPFLFKVELCGTNFKILFALNMSAWSIDVFIDNCTISL